MMKTLKLAAVLMAITTLVFSQSAGFYDNFEDGSADTLWNGTIYTLWTANPPHTFGLSESGGYLNIAYNRSAESAEWDNFNFTPPGQIDVSGNPVITLKIKSDVATTFTVKPIYTNENSDWLPQVIPADNAWHVYSFALTESQYAGANLYTIYMYLDGGSTGIKSGLVLFDDFQIAGFTISVNNLEAILVDSSKIDLQWQGSDPGNTDHFNIYRSTEPGFSLSAGNRIGETTGTLFHDSLLTKNTTYYYQVTAVDTEGREHAPAEVHMRTSTPGAVPYPGIISENANPVGRYEKYELVISMPEATFANPYNPEEIDLYAWFWSPGGDSVKMNGFYDNYSGADKWKIRFAANQAGTWTYRVFATDLDGTGQGETRTFEVVESDRKGWLHISEDNPNYLMHDDGSSFYGVSVYYPWSVTESGLDDFAAAGGNFFGYWDCTYDGSGNGGGRYLLESIESGIGNYDQRKAARIDEVLTWAEERDLKVMLAMWAHPYLRIEGVPWDGSEWSGQNPYSTVVDIDDFYTDSLSRAYHEKHYRYMIARWGYSQSLGIWEIINEIHGTTGWIRNQAAAKEWVEIVNGYFREHDPFQRPTTASFGGGEGASHYSETDKLGDIPNVHFYELHGWPNRYPGDVVRSGLSNVVSESRKLKSKGNRPAFFGEAGYTSMLADVATEAYTWELHNSFWAGLTNGLASTPFWWEFNDKSVLTAGRMQEYGRFGNFVEDIDFAHLMLSPTEIFADNTDGYFMGAPHSGFGWMKTYLETPVSGLPFYLSGTALSNGNYHLEWFNTWTGETVEEQLAIGVEGVSWGEVPAGVNQLDVAFKMNCREDGDPATGVRLSLVKADTLVDAIQPWLPRVDSTHYKIVCYVTDDNNRLDVAFNGPVEISMEGEGQPDPFTLDLREGGVLFNYIRSGSSGATVTATIEGLGSAVLYIEGITGTGQTETYSPAESLWLKNYPNPFNQKNTIEYLLPESAKIILAVYNAQGKLLETLVDDHKAAGHYQVEWDAGSHPAGLYFLNLRTGNLSMTGRCILLK
jgi:hypothetical protein